MAKTLCAATPLVRTSCVQFIIFPNLFLKIFICSQKKKTVMRSTLLLKVIFQDSLSRVVGTTSTHSG